MASHGGAGLRAKADYGEERRVLADLAAVAHARLARGAAALEVVVEAVRTLEACGLFMAGRGARPNSAGLYELDAALMDGPSQKAGAVAALQGFQSPIDAAVQVMRGTPHVLLVGEGAAAFCRGRLPVIDNPEAWYNGAFAKAEDAPAHGPEHGTVGCVALDRGGRLAAATSTAGVHDKLWGRVGDSPLIGAGTWADGTAAVSCTGLGEAFIRCAAASQVALRLRLTDQTLDAAADAVLAEVAALGGRGGLIAIDRAGTVVAPFNAQMMAFALVQADGRIRVEA